MKKNFLFFLLSFTLLSCENSEPISCYLPSTTITSNSPVISGDNIVLTSTECYTGANYEWTGPNGFQSSEQNPVLTNVTSAMAGEYKLKIKKGICESEIVSTNVNIIQNTITCTPINNTGTFSHQFYPVTYYNITANSISSNQFEFYAGEVNSNVKIIFEGNTYPSSGMYRIVDPSANLGSNEVKISTTIGFAYYNAIKYDAKSGDVLVSYKNGKLYAVFCSISFYRSGYTNSSFTGTVKITED